jgi:hypothetical protein
LDVNTTAGHKVIEWKIDQSIVAPRLGMSLRQEWPYAPYQAMIVTLPLAARASTLFLTLAVITLLLCSVEIRLSQFALLGLLFLVPFLILMSGGIPHPASISVEQFASYQTRMLPVLALLSLSLAFFMLRKIPSLPFVLILILMALFVGGYPLIGLLLDEQKRKAFETIVQVGMIAYVFLLALLNRLRKVNRQGG